MQIVLTFANAAIAASAAALVAGMVGTFRALVKLHKAVDKLVIADQAQADAIRMLVKIQRPQLAAHKATLEALEGNVNGNVKDAKKAILDSFCEYDDFLSGRV